jgi:alpha-methylacyl-CoA racemase
MDPVDMPRQEDRARWREGRERLQAIFATRSRDEWVALFRDSDACVTLVLSVEESIADPHMRARGTYVQVGGYAQAGPAPRLSRTQPGVPKPPRPTEGREVLEDWFSDAELSALAASDLLK